MAPWATHKTRLKRPQFPFRNGRVVAWYGRKIVCHPKIGGKITGIVVPSGGTLGKNPRQLSVSLVENLREENPELHGIIVPK